MYVQKVRELVGPLQEWYIATQVKSIDALDLERRVIAEYVLQIWHANSPVTTQYAG
jgi:hypothetical protein